MESNRSPFGVATVCDVSKDRGIFSLHIGGSKFSAGVVSMEGTVLLRDRVPAAGKDPWVVIAGLIKRIQAAATDFDVIGTGVTISGPIDVRKGSVSPLNIPTWREFPLAERVAELTGVRTTIDTEAKGLVLAEHWTGSARGAENFIAVYAGSTVSAGMMLNGRVLDGNFGNAGSIGHLVVEPGGRECRCRGKGCLEAYVSARAVESETGHQPAHASQALKERNALHLGRAVASALALVDVPLVLIGGSIVGAWGEPFVELVEAEIRSRSRLEFTSDVECRLAAHGNYGVLVGGAALVRRRLSEGS